MAAYPTPLPFGPGSQDSNAYMGTSELINADSSTYNYPSQPEYEQMTQHFPVYPGNIIPNQYRDDESPEEAQMAAQYGYNVPLMSNNPSLRHSPTQTPQYPFRTISQHSHLQNYHYANHHDPFQIDEVESQESANESTMLSEPVVPHPDGFPEIRDFDQLISCYVKGLSSKKQDKALIHAKRAKNIHTVLMDKKTTAVESAQFRFWVKKMFSLSPIDPKSPGRGRNICHEGKPVAIREKLFKILVHAHRQCQHGGRDKTSAQVRRIYSWVPKELISRFVKLCPTCQARRGGNPHGTPPVSPQSSANLYLPRHSPEPPTPPGSRRTSVLSHRSAVYSPSSSSASMFGEQYQGQPWPASSHGIHNPGVSQSHSSNGAMTHSAMSHLDQQSIPVNYNPCNIQGGGGSTHRPYPPNYEGNPYSTHQHY